MLSFDSLSASSLSLSKSEMSWTKGTSRLGLSFSSYDDVKPVNKNLSKLDIISGGFSFCLLLCC